MSGCVVGPNYRPPTTVVPKAFKEGKQWKIAEPKDDWDRGRWWTVFHDSKLNELEDCLNLANPNIQSAYHHYIQAKAMVDEARSAYFPIVSFTETASAQKSGVSLFPGTFGGQTGTSPAAAGIVQSHTFIFNASWQPDLWGLVRRTVEANEAAAQASAALLANTRLSMQGSLAQTYFELRTLDSDQRILDKTVVLYQKSFALMQNQYRSGIVSEANVLQSKSALESAQASAINNRINRAVYEHAIAVLIGRPPGAFSLSPKPLTKEPPTIPGIVPSELLERRPDIAQAERTMKQLNAQIGATIAAYFPTLSLSANIANSGVSHLGTGWGWATGEQSNAIIFNGGLFAARVKAARAAYSSSIASYRQVVLAAFQNVEDNLATLNILIEESVVQRQALNTIRQSQRITQNQYQSGVVDYSGVINAQISTFTAEKALSDVTGQRFNAAVGLVMALGGGWHEHCKSNILPKMTKQ